MIRTIGRQRVEVFDHPHDTGAERNFVLFQAGRIAAPVPTFVVTQNEWSNGRRKRDGMKDGGSHFRVHTHLLKLFRRERTWLGENVIRDRELADIMQQRRSLGDADICA